MSEHNLMEEQELRQVKEVSDRLLNELNAILFGKEELHRLVLAGILSRGHILLEGLPGSGKTALVKALGELMQLDFKRVQFTPDLMPGDILGSHILQETAPGHRELTFEPGPVFTHILLADEINRASPKTQSALLEAMQEGAVTLLGQTRRLPHPFFVLASQNPIEQEGTYPLPEAQLDRFLFRLSVVGGDARVLFNIITSRRRGEAPRPSAPLSRQELDLLYAAMERVYLPRAVAEYIARVVALSDPRHPEAPEAAREYLMYGASPRAAIALAESARALALLDGRGTVGFEDVRRLLEPVLNHRLILSYRAKIDRVSTQTVVQGLQAAVRETDLRMHNDISWSN